MKVSTAEELLRNKYKLEGNKGMLRIDQLVYIMTDYAKLHVTAALEAAISNAEADFEPLGHTPKSLVAGIDYEVPVIRATIKNSYPLSNIK
jgi:hypothetical protein